MLDVYECPPNPKRPVIGFDEKPCQLIGEVLVPINPKPGRVKRVDSEYQRHGSVNLFGWVEPRTGKRDVWVTERRTAVDYAHALKRVADAFPEADVIVVVKITSTPTAKPRSIKPLRHQKPTVWRGASSFTSPLSMALGSTFRNSNGQPWHGRL